MDWLNLESPSVLVALAVLLGLLGLLAAMALFAQELHHGPAFDRGDFLRPQTHPGRRQGQQVARWASG